MPHTLVTFHAHPDDEALLTAGVMARAADEGHRVVAVFATDGEAGDADAGAFGRGRALGRHRRAEAEAAAAVLGVSRVVFLGYADSGSGAGPVAAGSFAAADADDVAGRLAQLLDEESADVLTVYDRFGGYGHPDHVQVHRAGGRAGERAGTPIVLEATISRELLRAGAELAGGLGYDLGAIFSPDSFDDWYLPEAQINTVVDVTAQLPRKRAAMQAHASQASSSTASARSLAVFASLPDEYFALAFGREWFVRRGAPAGTLDDDVFARLP